MQPGAQSNEFSSRMQIKKHSGSKKDVQLLLGGLVRSIARIGNAGIKAYIHEITLISLTQTRNREIENTIPSISHSPDMVATSASISFI